ncbi:hypothetical protein SAMN02982929_06885 [Saccharopolyspora kobensis]|uniref:Transposase n=1 Tax=Saccharopolyspora kobensis TaxID=146035 RepID=A0A1H6EIT9_9PSEU|nr:hypothetical protein [Saccharopolyspora kobensis]SEG97810.1 hypothetical protein SAMN02982929_06885 [Saccharopolyspora kobensis]SFF24761.1 hypothetical protein SAMN05216506_12357 [Saccharopolyspora kobensis]
MNELTAAEREELDRLRRENHLLRVEKEMLLRIATEYALDQRVPAVSGESGS